MALGLLAACAWEPPTELTADRAPGVSSHASVVDADLVVRSVRGPRSAQPWGPLEVSVEVCNQGGVGTPYNDVRVVLSEDDVIDELDIELGAQPVSALAPGACTLVNVWGSAPALPGGYRLGAIADVLGMVPEADESNNAGAGSALAVGYDPDLVVDRIRAPATAPFYGSIEVEVRVCNHGQSPGSYDTTVVVELTADGQPQPLPGGAASVPYLQPGDCFNAAVLVYFPSSALAYELVATVDPLDEVVEIVEDNNSHAGGRVGVGYGADLSVTEIAAATSAWPGEGPAMTVTACNQGQAPAWANQIELYLSEDDAFDPMTDMLIGHAEVDELFPAQCATFDAYVYSVPSGAFRLVAVIDPHQHESEIFEDNNVLLGELVGFGHQPDLVVAEVARAPGWYPFEDFEARVRVCNQGQQYSDSTDLALHISIDDQITPADLPAGMAPVPGLAPGACAAIHAWVNAPPVEGAFVLGAIVDPYDDVNELIEANNAGAGPRIGIGFEPDLVITAVNAPASASVWGGGTSVFVQVCNYGPTHSAGPSVELYASRNDDISVDDVFVGGAWVSGLEPGACTSVAVHGLLDVAPGTYLLGAVVDDNDSIAEIIEDNNAGFSAPIAVGDGPDLVVTAVTAPPSVSPGAGYEISTTVCNQGFAPSPGAPLEVLVSQDRHISRGTDWIVGFAFIGQLAPGQCHTSSIPVASHAGGAALWLAAVVDMDDSVDEIIEDNNGRLARIGAGVEPDLVVTSVSAPPTVQPYESMEVTARVCNQGQSPSPGTDVVVQLGGAAFSPVLPPAGMAPVPALEPGACTDVLIAAQAMGLAGEQVLTATADPMRWGVYELIEDNNTSPAVPIGIGYDADLIVATVSGPASAQPWGSFDVTARVCNQGEWDSYGARLDIVLSPDPHIDAIDHVIATIPVSLLAPGACEDLSVPAQALVHGGVFTLGAVVHQDSAPLELVSSNNGTAGGTLAIGWDADLVVSAVKGPVSAAMGSELAIRVRVCNQGQSPSQPTDVWAVLSRDAIVDMGDTVDAPAAIAPLESVAPGACTLVSVPTFAHHGEGTYAAGALIDPWNAAYELIESNNTRAGPAVEIVAPL